jgi:creatinine amidohydrolase
MELVAQQLRVRLGMVAVTTSWSRLGTPPGLLSAADMAHDWHGGLVETSLMLAARPELVAMERATDFRSRGAAMEADYKHVRATRPAGFSWMAQDLNPAGALGDASRATPEIGEAVAGHGAAAFVELLQEVARFSL